MKKYCVLLSSLFLMTLETMAQVPVDVLKFSSGAGLTYAGQRQYTSYYVQPHRYYDSMWGVEHSLGYERMIWRFIGAGVNFDYCKSEQTKDGFDIGYENGYIGPCVVLATNFGRCFRLDGNLGIGASLFADGGNRSFALGFRLGIGMEYRFGKSMGVGVEIVEHLSNFGDDNLNRYGQPFKDIYRASLLIGVRYYPKFK